MKTCLDCLPCMLRQALETARVAAADVAQQRADILVGKEQQI